MATISNVMATAFKTTGTAEAAQSLKSLTSAIKNATSSWKAEEAQMRSSGDRLGAVQAKYNGLGDSMSKLQDKINLLKERLSGLDQSTQQGKDEFAKYTDQLNKAKSQYANLSAQQERASKSLDYYKSGLGDLQNSYRTITSASKAYVERLEAEGKTQEANKAKIKSYQDSIDNLSKQLKIQEADLAKIDTSTEKGTEAYTKQKQRVDETAASIASFSTKLKKAQSDSTDYATSMNALKSSYQKIQAADKAYADRLAAEGKTRDAATAKIKTYKSAIDNLNDQLKVQETELSRVASESGKDSEAYTKQKQNVDETATALAKAKNQMNDFNDSMKKANPSFFDKLKLKLTETDDKAKDTSHSISDIVKGSAIGSAIGNGISNLASALGSAAKNGFQLDIAGDELRKRWSNLGVPTKAVGSLMDQIGRIRSVSNESGTAINALQVRLYDLTGSSIPKTKALTNEMFAFGKEAGLSGVQIDSMGGKLTRLLSNQKVSLVTFNRTFADMPGLKEAIIKASGLTTEAFDQAIIKGKISGKQIEGYMLDASKNSGKAWASFGSTAEGKMDKVKGTFANLEAAFMKPIETTALNGVNKVMASLVGKRGGLTSTGKAVSGIVNNLSKKASSGISSAINFIVKNKGALSSMSGSIVKIAENIGKGVWKTFSGLLSDISGHSDKAKSGLSGVASSMSKIGKNKAMLQTIGKLLATYFVAKPFVEMGAGIVSSALKFNKWVVATKEATKAQQQLTIAQKAFNLVMNHSTFAIIVTAVVALGVAFVELYKHCKPFRDFINGIGKAISKAFSGVGAVLGKVGKAFSSTFNGIIKFFKSNWKQVALFIANPIVGGFALLYKNVKPFRNFINGLAKTFKSGFSGMTKTLSSWGKNISKWVKSFSKSFGKVWSSAWKGIGKTFSSIWNGFTKTISSWGKNISKWYTGFTKTFSKAWKSGWKSVGTFLSSSWKGMKTTISDWGTKIGKWHDEFHKGFHKVWSAGWNVTKKALSTAWDKMKSTTSTWGKNIASWHNSFHKAFHKVWSAGWDTTKKFLSTSWTAMHKLSTSWGKTMSGWLTSFNKTFSKGWKSMWGGIKSFMSDTWKNIKNGAKAGFNGVIGIINDVIGAINSVWKFFTGKKALGTLKKLAKGGVITATQRLVMVNDDGTSNPKELIQLPTGQMGFFNGRNVKALLPEGTRVYNSKETKQIFNMAGIDHYAKGGIVGTVEKAVSGTADKLKEIGDWLAHPVKSVENMISKAISGASAGIKGFTTLATGIVHKLTSSIAKWFKEKLEKLQDELSVPNPSGSGVMRWKPEVIKALKANGFSASDLQVKSWLAVIQRESGGNPRAINNWDSNAKAGIPSMGLVQTIGPTFNAYKFPGHGNVYNGYDDLLAGIHYMKAIYGSGSGAFERVADPNIGYANGGIVNQEQLAWIGEGNKTETVIPWDLSKRSRAYQLMDETMQAFKKDDSRSATSNDDSTLVQLLQSLIQSSANTNALLNKLLNKSSDIYLDGDALVGATAGKYDQALGKTMQLNERWHRQ